MTDYPLTFECNNNCISCISNTEIFSKYEDPTIDKLKEVIDKIDPDNDYWGVGGGEPTLRKEFFDLLEYARKRHPDLYIFITTNGRMFYYKKFARRLADLNLGNYMVGIPLYGHNAKLHDLITRAKGSFQETVKGVKNLLHYGVPVEVRVIINKLNYKKLPEIAGFVSKNFPGIEKFVLVNMKYTGNALLNKDKIFVKISDVVPFAEEAVEISEKRDIKTRLYHFPLCILPEHLREIAKGVTKRETEELTFVDACEDCRLKDECPRIWRTYVGLQGDEEFEAIKRNMKS